MTPFSLRHVPLLAAAASVLVAPGLSAQKSQEELQQSFAEMQTHPWYVDGGWTTDFAAAKAQAAETGRPVFAYFTRTYAP